MAKKLFIRNLSWNTNEESLQSACSQYGTVESTAIITDKMSGRSKGFGFVEMSTDEEALAVIDALNGKELDGREIFVSEARPPEERPRREGGFSGNRGGSSSRGGFGGGSRGGYGRE